MPIRASVFRIIHFIIPLNWEIQWRYMLFKGRLLYDFHPVLSLDYEWNFGASFGWKQYDEHSIGTMTLSVLKSMRISIWALS